MAIKGSKGYCQYCRAGEEKNELILDKKSHNLICTACQAEINRYEELINTMEKRLTPMLENFLVKTCLERSRTNPMDERYKEKKLFVTKDKHSISEMLTKNMLKNFREYRVLPIKHFISQTYYFGRSDVDLFVIQVQREVLSKNYKTSLIGRIELSELQEILR